MIHIFMARHGETVWHRENRYAGRTEVELSDAGREQAGRLAQWAKAAGIQRLYVSPQKRAIDTMRPVAEAVAIEPAIDPRLREVDFGVGEGMTRQEMERKIPDARRRFDEDPVGNPLPGGEDPRQALARGREALHAIVEDAARSSGPPPLTLVVFHNTLIRLLLCDALGIDPSLYRKVFPRVDCATLLELGFPLRTPSSPPIVSLLGFNLPPEIAIPRKTLI